MANKCKTLLRKSTELWEYSSPVIEMYNNLLPTFFFKNKYLTVLHKESISPTFNSPLALQSSCNKYYIYKQTKEQNFRFAQYLFCWKAAAWFERLNYTKIIHWHKLAMKCFLLHTDSLMKSKYLTLEPCSHFQAEQCAVLQKSQ